MQAGGTGQNCTVRHYPGNVPPFPPTAREAVTPCDAWCRGDEDVSVATAAMRRVVAGGGFAPRAWRYGLRNDLVVFRHPE